MKTAAAPYSIDLANLTEIAAVKKAQIEAEKESVRLWKIFKVADALNRPDRHYWGRRIKAVADIKWTLYKLEAVLIDYKDRNYPA